MAGTNETLFVMDENFLELCRGPLPKASGGQRRRTEYEKPASKKGVKKQKVWYTSGIRYACPELAPRCIGMFCSFLEEFNELDEK